MSDLISEHGFIPLAVLMASLAGSLHCTAMCGPLITASARGFRSMACYHLGRLLGYLALGALAGAVGHRIFSPSLQGAIQIAAALAVGLTFIFLGWGVWRGKGAHLLPSRYLTRLFPKVMRAERLGEYGRGAAVGLLSSLLPCGWLHSFVLAAVTTRDAGLGAALLAVFWAGTLPAVTVGPALILRGMGPLTRLAPKISGSLLILAGIVAIGLKMAPVFQASVVDDRACALHAGH